MLSTHRRTSVLASKASSSFSPSCAAFSSNQTPPGDVRTPPRCVRGGLGRHGAHGVFHCAEYNAGHDRAAAGLVPPIAKGSKGNRCACGAPVGVVAARARKPAMYYCCRTAMLIRTDEHTCCGHATRSRGWIKKKKMTSAAKAVRCRLFLRQRLVVQGYLTDPQKRTADRRRNAKN